MPDFTSEGFAPDTTLDDCSIPPRRKLNIKAAEAEADRLGVERHPEDIELILEAALTDQRSQG